MINQKFIDNALKGNPSIATLADLADQLDTRAGECFKLAEIAKGQKLAAVVVRMTDIGINAQDTCDAIRAEIYKMIGACDPVRVLEIA